MLTRKTFACLLLVLASSYCAFAVVDVVEPTITFSWEPVGDGESGELMMSYGEGNAKRKPDPKNPHRFTIQDQMQWTHSELDVDMTYDEDPFVAGAFGVVNNSASDIIYTITFTSPINPSITPATLYGGSMSGSYTDSGKDGAILISTVQGDPLYQGMIDGVDIYAIYADPSSWTALNGIGSGNILAAGSATTNPGPSAISTISLQYKFKLSAGDTATMNGRFEVLPVPEPATLSILGLGGLLMMRKREH